MSTMYRNVKFSCPDEKDGKRWLAKTFVSFVAILYPCFDPRGISNTVNSYSLTTSLPNNYGLLIAGIYLLSPTPTMMATMTRHSNCANQNKQL